MVLHFYDGFLVNQRAQSGTLFQPVTHFERGHGCCQLLGKGVINARLHVDSIRTNAGLAIIAKFAHDRAGHCGVEIGIIKYNKWRVAPQFHRTFHHAVCGLTQQASTHWGGSGKGEFAHDRIFTKFFANLGGLRGGED